MCGRLPRPDCPTVWSVTSACQSMCVVGYLGLSAKYVVGYLGLSVLACGRLPRSVRPNVVCYLGLSAKVWSVVGHRKWVKRRGKEEAILPGLGLDSNQLFFLSSAQVRLSWTLVT